MNHPFKDNDDDVIHPLPSGGGISSEILTGIWTCVRWRSIVWSIVIEVYLGLN